MMIQQLYDEQQSRKRGLTVDPAPEDVSGDLPDWAVMDDVDA